MNPKIITALLLSAFLASSALASDLSVTNPDELLRKMSVKLAAAKSFRFEATREIDPALLEGRDVPEKARISVAVQRPNKFSARSVSQAGARRFIADGRTLALLDEKKNHYATVPMPTTLDGLVAQLDEKYGFTPPLAEFALSNPYADFHQQAQSVTYLGLDKVATGFFGLGGVECHRLALKGRVRVMYGGYNCYFVGGVYYRAVMYEGATVYVIVT